MIVNFGYSNDFSELISHLEKKYGPQIIELEGFGSNLDIDNFNKKFFSNTKISDVSIDSNANVRSKHIGTYFSEISKSFTKLNSIYVIWKEMKKLYGKEIADKFVEYQINGAIYLHDAHHSAYMPYCVMRDELLHIKDGDGNIKLLSIEELYDMVDKKEEVIDEKAVEKNIADLSIYVKDRNGWTQVTRLVKKKHDNKFVFIKLANGMSKVVTEDHHVITDAGEMRAIDVKPGMKIYSEKVEVPFGDVKEVSLLKVLEEAYGKDYIREKILVDGIPYDEAEDIPEDAIISLNNSQFFMKNKIELDKEFGWVLGIIIAEGNFSQETVAVTNKDKEILERLKKFAKKHGINFAIYEKHDGSDGKRFRFKNKLFYLLVKYFIAGDYARNKSLRFDFFKFNKDFLYGIVGGIIDGDRTQMANFIKGRSNRIVIRMTSRKLLNQLRSIIQSAGYIVRDGTPRTPGKNSQVKSNHMVYNIAFTPLKNGELFASQKVTEFKDRLTTTGEIKRYSNKRYTFDYGWQEVTTVKVFEDFTEEYVYDLTTESHSFLVNGIETHNCFAYTLQPIVEKGLPFIDTIQSTPAKHLSTFIQHVIQFVMFASNQSSGAVGLPDFFVWMWYYVKKDLEEGIIPEDKFNWYIEQHFQILTYSFNQPIRTNQSPYTNFTYLDRNYIKAIFDGEKYPDGTPIVDEIENIIKLQKHYWEWVAKERERQMFTFPVLTATLLYKDGKFVDEDSARFINKVNMKWQDTNWYISDSVDAVASCCRLTSSTKDLKLSLSLGGENEPEKLSGMANSVGGSDLNIGSFKVVTINLPRIALEANRDKDKFLKILIERIDIVQKVLYVIRNILKERIEQAVLPLYNVGLMKLERQYGTIGITGVWEAADFMGLTELTAEGLKYSPEGEQFISEILDLIRKKAEEGFKKYKFTFNIEQVPAEKAAVTLAEKDKLLFGEDKQPYRLYSNQWIPLIADTDMMNRIRYAGKWDKKVSGGAILHINIGTPFKSEEESWKLINLIAKKGVMYFAFNQKISTCENGHAFIGNKCPVCGKNKVEEYIRIVGYLVPSGSFNKTRREFEYDKRKFYTLEGVES